ncbi:MAG: HAD-IIB family hydrolase [Pseudomonadota bacterium]
MIDPCKCLVATDLDGTLLDHNTYDWAPAGPALETLSKFGVPVLFTTSKTRAEVELLRETIGNSDPFIVENGGALIVSPGPLSQDGAEHLLGVPHPTIMTFLEERRAEGFLFESFTDLGITGIAEETGLSPEEAHLANQRSASEPIIWHGDEASKRAFVNLANEAGFNALQGGRFLTLGGRTDKGRALREAVSLYRATGHRIETIVALGDSGNDRALLDVATHPIWIRKNGPTPETGFMNRAHCSVRYGPEGWCDVILDLFDGTKV